MKCKKYYKLVMRYFDHDLTESEQKLLSLHTQACQHCRTLFDKLNKIFVVLEDAPPVEPDPNLEKSVLARVKSLPLFPVKDEYRLIKNICGPIALLVFLLFSTIAHNVQTTDFSDILFHGADYLNSFTEILWNLQIIYDISSGLFPQMTVPLFQNIQSFYITGVIFAVVLCFKIAIGLGKMKNEKLVHLK
jgi:hypothetical protein